MVKVARLFRAGGSLAVRLPKEFGLKDRDEVCIKRVGSCVMIFPKGKAWELTKEAVGQVDDDFLADRNQPEWTDKRNRL